MVKSKTATKSIVEEVAGLDGTELVERLQQVPEIFANYTGEALLQQVPGLKQKAVAHKAKSEQGVLLGQLKDLTRAYRREILLSEDSDRLEPGDVVGYLNELESILSAADAAGLGREVLVAKADGLTQKIVATMAVVGLLV